MTRLRLKCSTNSEQIKERLSHKPDILELHLTEVDLEGEALLELTRIIEDLQSKNVTVYLHHPMKYKGEALDILHKNQEIREFYFKSCRILSVICRAYHIKCVLHCHYSGTESSNYQSKEKTLEMKKEMEKVLAFTEHVFLWENTIEGLFSYHNPYLMDTIIKPLHLPLVHDISHTFIGVNGNNKKLLEITKQIDPYVKYLHVVDSLGESHDGLELGTGKVQWKPLVPYIQHKPYIYEIALENFLDSSPMNRSAHYLEALFD